MNLILFNGPPRSGKDTSAEAAETYLTGLPSDYWVEHEKFSAPLKTAFAGMMQAHIDNRFKVAHYEDHKEDIVPELGVSFRKWQQDYSEKFMKPLYGNAVFGRLLLGRLDRMKSMTSSGIGPDFIIISDCGFQIEVDYCVESGVFKNVLLFRVARDGCSYAGDTRAGVNLKQSDGTSAILYNATSLAQLRCDVCDAIEDWLKVIHV